jgi:potassium uptake Trk family protein
MDDLGVRRWLWAQVKSMKPAFMSKEPHFNFISAHYFWVIGLALLGSVVIYGSRNAELAYIDALVFATGANTQAGLNTVDVSNLNTFQQAVIYILSMLTNPITINSFVVFLRLYWFEKRFQRLVREARARRGTVSKSKAKIRTDADLAERGVNGRNITVNHGQRARITNDGIVLENEAARTANGGLYMTGGKMVDSHEDVADAARSTSSAEHQEGRNTEISFAPTVNRDGNLERMKLPQARTSAEHIAILERQRMNDDEVLRIPGPRDVERGIQPKRVEEGDEEDPEPLSRKPTNYSIDGQNESTPQRNNNNQGRQQTIMIEEPDRRRRTESHEGGDDWVTEARAVANAFSFLRFRRPRLFSKKDKRLHHDEDNIHVTPSRSKRRQTFDTLRSAFTRERDYDGTPYLSWEPTLGRNSAFPDLSEEQREELGGIEYRSLKTLAMILTIYFWGFSALGVACLLPWILNVNVYGQVVDNINQSRTWWGFFTPNSAFMDLGYTLTPDSMNSFNTAVFPMILMSFLIVIGNTGFPVMLRFIIWVSSKIVPHGTGLYEELMFLLDHPRRCFTLLFPSGATWWLFWLLVILNGLDLIFFIVLDVS